MTTSRAQRPSPEGRRDDATIAGLKQENAQLQHAVGSHSTVDQAIGVLLATHRMNGPCGPALDEGPDARCADARGVGHGFGTRGAGSSRLPESGPDRALASLLARGWVRISAGECLARGPAGPVRRPSSWSGRRTSRRGLPPWPSAPSSARSPTPGATCGWPARVRATASAPVTRRRSLRRPSRAGPGRRSR
jgi:hypothetical protein